nr:immunoglobulin light chain junction region [Macaca mulatta]MOX10143.1 immunoglobulin light chain junction region [Macaca mulatta]
CAQAIEFPWTF